MLDLPFGKYAFYILSSYGLTFIALAGLTIWAVKAHWRAKRAFEAAAPKA